MRYDVCVYYCSTYGTRDGTLTQGGALFSLRGARYVFITAVPGCCLLLQYLIQSCARGGRRIVEDMYYEIRRAEACVD